MYVLSFKRMEWAHKVVLESHFSEVAQSYMKTTRFSFEGAWHWDWQAWYIQSPLTMQCCSPCQTWTREGHQVNFFSPWPENWLQTRSDLYVWHDQREVGPIHFAIFTCLNSLSMLFPYFPETNRFWNCCLFRSDHYFTSALKRTGVVTWYFCRAEPPKSSDTQLLLNTQLQYACWVTFALFLPLLLKSERRFIYFSV